MQVKEIYQYGSGHFGLTSGKVGSHMYRVLEFARFACEKEPFDAMEKAIAEVYQESGYSEHYRKMEFIHEYALGGRPPMMTHVYRSVDGTIVAGKGAPERILKVCRLNEQELRLLEKIVLKMTSSGYRVLGVCSAINPAMPFPAMQDDLVEI
jgi:Ca2+-transporting ATPase